MPAHYLDGWNQLVMRNVCRQSIVDCGSTLIKARASGAACDHRLTRLWVRPPYTPAA